MAATAEETTPDMNYPQYNPASDDRPLSDEELNELDELLAALPADEAMNIEALDGYLAALLLAPTPLQSLPGNTWLPVVWGGDQAPDPAPFVSGKQRKKVVMLVLRHLQSIATAWRQHPNAWEPIFSQASDAQGQDFADAEDWSAGFLAAVALEPDAWAPWFDAEDSEAWLAPIVALGAEDGVLAEASAAQRDAASRLIPDAMLAMWARRQRG